MKTASMHTIPAAVTTLDFIKTFAVICMLIDHIGYYFFPDAEWFRAIGRLGGAPVWFFLIGYALSRSIPHTWMIGAVLLCAADFILFDKVFPFNVLVTIIAVRLAIDPVMGFVLRSRFLFWISVLVLSFSYIATNMLSEYATLAVVCAVAGYVTRHRERLYALTFLTPRDYYSLLAAMVVAVTFLQAPVFGFNGAQTAFVAIASALLTAVLVTMEPKATYPSIGGLPARVLRLGGRKTLEIYVVHLLAFKALYVLMAILGVAG